MYKNAALAMSVLAVVLMCAAVFLITDESDVSEAADGDTFTNNSVTYQVISESEKTAKVLSAGTSVSGEIGVDEGDCVNGYTIVEISANAFKNRANVTTVNYPNVTVVGDNAFYGCTGMTSVTIHMLGIYQTTVGAGAFQGCTSLTTVNGWECMESIGASAFQDCTSLKSVYLTSVTSLGDKAFYRCTGLTMVRAVSCDIPSYAFSGCIALSYIELKADLTIGSYAFSHCESFTTYMNFSTLNVEIKDHAFEYCTKLTRVIFKSITGIGDSAFSSCTSLTTVTGMESVKSIGNGAFYSCYNLDMLNPSTTVAGTSGYAYIGPKVTSVSSTAFECCSKIVAFTVSSNSLYKADESALGALYKVNGSNYSLIECARGVSGTFKVLSNTTEIQSDAFYGCNNLTKVILPASLETIGGSLPFDRCDALTAIEMTGTAKTTGEVDNGHYATYNGALYNTGCTKLLVCPYKLPGEEYTYGEETVMIYKIHSSTTEIGSNAFRNNVLTAVMIGASMTSVSSSSFQDASKLKYILVDEGNSKYASDKGVLYSLGSSGSGDLIASIVAVPATVSSITIVDSLPKSGKTYYVTEIAEKAFYSSDLTGVTFECTHLTTIGSSAFMYSSITSITIPNSVTTIGSNAFYGSSLKSVVLGTGLASIGTEAFTVCSDLNSLTMATQTVDEKTVVNHTYTAIDNVLYSGTYDSTTNVVTAKTLVYCPTGKTELTIEPTTESIAPYAFDRCEDLTSVSIPASVTSIGSCAFRYCHSLSQITFEMGFSGATIGSNSFALGLLWENTHHKVSCNVVNADDGYLDPYSDIYTVFTYQHSVQYSLGVGKDGKKIAGDVPASFIKKTGETFDLDTALLPVREGYDFFGWTIEIDGVSYTYDFYEVVDDTYQKKSTYNVTVVVGGNNIIATAHWVARDYTIKFYKDSTEESMKIPVTQKFTYDVSADLTGNAFTKTGYHFLGWSKGASATTVDYTDKKTILNETSLRETISLYAVWEANTYYVEFDKNGADGEEEMAKQTFTYDTESDLTTNAFTKTGYHFLGWATTSSAKTAEYADGATLKTLTEDKDATVKFYAVWEANSYTIQYSLNGGSGTAIATVPAKYDAKYTLSDKGSDWSRTGYTFVDWLFGSTHYSVGAEVSNLTTEDGATVTLNAGWSANKYTVKFDGNKPEGSSKTPTAPSDIEVIYDSTYGSLTDSTMEGYTFLGWFTAATSGDSITSETVVRITDTTTLYAHWRANTYTIAFSGNGSDGGENVNSITATFDQTYKAPSCAWTRTGYTFSIWNSKADGSGTGYAVESDLKNLSSVDGSTVTIYAKWTANEYSVSYDSNKPSSSTQDPTTIDVPITVTFDSKYGTLGTVSMDGYTFGGWYLDKACSSDKAVTSEILVKTASNHTLYAKWTPIGYTVSFVKNLPVGCTSDFTLPADLSVSFNGEYVGLSDVSMTGYTFGGWYLDEACSSDKKVTADSQVTTVGDHDLYAKWTVKTYTVTLDKNEGSADGSVTATYDASLPSFTALTRTGYTLSGYYTAATDGTKVIGADGKLIASVTGYTDKDAHWIMDGSVTLYAQWTANKYTVTFDGNSQGTSTAEVDPSSKSVTYDSTYGTLADVTMKGYTFVGWFTAKDNTGVQVTADDTVSITANQTLYAHWTANTYTVYFDKNGSNNGPDPGSKTVTYDQKYGTLATNTMTSYNFVGWFTAASGGDEITEDSIVNITADQRLYAHWVIKESHTVTYEDTVNPDKVPAPVSVVEDGTITLPEYPYTSGGVPFVGWVCSVDGVTYPSGSSYVMGTADVTFTASYDKTGLIQVTFHSNYKSGTEEDVQMYIAKGVTFKLDSGKSFTKTGYTFTKWNTSADGKGTDYNAGASYTMGETALDFYSVWTANKYNVVFDGNKQGTSVPSVDPTYKTVTYDSTYGDLATATMTGYSFVGWFTEKTGGTQILSTSTVAITAMQTLYAHWTVNTYTVTFNGNDQGSSTATVPESKTVTYDSTYGELTSATMTGYTFVGWFTAADSTGTQIDSDTSVTITANQNLYAHWTANTYYVVFSSNDSAATGTMAKEEFTYDVAKALTSVGFSKSCYHFMGWATTTGTTTCAYTDGQTVKNLASVQGAEVTIYAVWEINHYKIYTVDVPGSDPALYATIDDGSTVSKPTDPTRTGYVFRDWYTTSDLKSTEVYDFTTVITGKAYDYTMTIYAGWKQLVDVPTAVTGLVYTGGELTGVAEGTLYNYDDGSNKATNAGSHVATVVLSNKYDYIWNVSTPTTDDQTVTWSIGAKSLVDNTTFSSIAAQVYTAKEIKPDFTLKDTARNLGLTEGTDFTVKYSDNVNKGTATVTVTGKDNYKDSVSTTFTINAKDISSSDVEKIIFELKDSLTYTGVKQTQEIKDVKYNGTTVSVDVTVTNNEQKDAGAYSGSNALVITGNGNFTGSVKMEFTIACAELALGDIDDITYDGKSSWVITIKGQNDEDVNVTIFAADGNVEDGKAITRATSDTSVNKNYLGDVDVNSKTVDIVKKLLEISVDQDEVYDGKEFTVGYGKFSTSGLVSGDFLTAGALTTKAKDVKDYTKEADDWSISTPLAADMGIANYDVKFTSVSLEIKQKVLKISVDQDKVYDGEKFTVGYGNFVIDSTDGLVSGDSLTAGALTTSAKDVKDYKAVADWTISTELVATMGIGNYDVQFTSVSMEITKAVLTVTPESGQHKTYGDSDPAIAYANSGAIGTEVAGFTGVLSRVSGEDVIASNYLITVGTLALADNGTFLADNYEMSFVDTVVFAIDTAKIVLNENKEKDYDIDETLTFDLDTGINSEVLTITYTASSVNAGTYAYGTGDKTYSVSFAGKDGTTVKASNYSLKDSYSVTFKINKVALTLKVVDKSISFNDALPYSTCDQLTATGFVGSETFTDLDETLKFASAYKQGDATDGKVGTYTVSASGYTSVNYSISYEGGTLTVGKLSITITGDSDDSIVYDASTHTITTYQTTGSLVAGHTVKATYSVSGLNVWNGKDSTGVYTGAFTEGMTSIVNGDGDEFVSNYDITYVAGTITISPCDLNLVARERTYDAKTEWSVTVNGLNGENGQEQVKLAYTFSSKVVGEYSYKAGSSIYSVEICETDGASTNYRYNYKVADPSSAKFTVNPAVFTVEPMTNRSKTYDGKSTFSEVAENVSGVMAGDSVVVTATSTFSKNVGTNTMTVVYSSTSPDYANYVPIADDTTHTMTITAATITVSETTADDKVYDGKVAAVTNLGTTWTGIVEADKGKVVPEVTAAVFASKNIGSDIAVKVTYGLTGEEAGNYVVTGNDTFADITVRYVTVEEVSAANKAYDGTAAANVTIVKWSGKQSNESSVEDDLDISVVAAFSNYNAGTGKSISMLFSLSGTDAGNYLVNSSGSVTTATADITAVELKLVDYSFTYDGSTSQTPEFEIDGVASEKLKVVYTAASCKHGEYSYNASSDGFTVELHASGADATNYVLPSTSDAKLTINKAEITVIPTAKDKVYDATLDVEVSVEISSGICGSDDVKVTAAGILADKNVGENKALTVAYTVSGEDMNNYTVVGTVETLYIDVSAFALTIAGTAVADKAYDGTDSALAYVTLGTVDKFASDNVAPTVSSAKFATANAGSGLDVSIAYVLSGTDAGNYTLADSTVKASIISKTVTVATIVANKVYDGTDAATITTGTINGKIGTDDVSVKSATGKFGGVVVGSYSVEVAYVLDGTSAGNYKIENETFSAEITARTISPVGVVADSKTYDGTVDATATVGSYDGIVSGDDISVSFTASFADADAGNGKTVTVVYTLSGTAAPNYTIADSQVSANINAKDLADDDVAFTATSFIYDGTEKTTEIAGTYTTAAGTVLVPTYVKVNDSGTAVSTYTTTLVGTGNYTGQKNVSWSIYTYKAVVSVDPAGGSMTFAVSGWEIVDGIYCKEFDNSQEGVSWSSVFSEINDATRTGYVFGGWVNKANGQSVDGTTYREVPVITLEAVWSSHLNTIYIAQPDHGTVSIVGKTLSNNAYVGEYGEAITFEYTSSDGYYLVSWIGAGEDGSLTITESTVVSCTVDNLYTVTYKENDGSMKIDTEYEYLATVQQRYGDVLELPAAPAIVPASDGAGSYVFRMWTGYAEGDTVTGDMQFTATVIFVPKDQNAYAEIDMDSVCDELTAENLADLADSGCRHVLLHCDAGDVSLDFSTLQAMADGGDVEVTLVKASDADLTDEQKAKLGNSYGIAVNAVNHSGQVHQLAASVKITVPYAANGGYSLFYLADDGSLTAVDASYDSGSKTLEFTTDHFSVYMVQEYSSEMPVTLYVLAIVILGLVASLSAAAWKIRSKDD